jgi:hypothetical protein
MKTHARTLSALALIAFLTSAAGSTSHGQTWQTILDLGPSTYGHDVIANPFLNSPLPSGVFVTGDIFSSAECETVFMDTAQPQSASNPSVVVPSIGLIDRLGFDSTLGALYSVGYIRKPDNSLSWDTRRSLDDGQTWVDLDSGWQPSAGAPTQATGFAADTDGELFACGTATDSKDRTHAILRKSVDHGVTWSTSVINASAALAIQSVPANPQNQGGLFTVGRLGNLWGVQRSRDGGTTWTTVDSWGPKNGVAIAAAITSDVQGTIYVAGHATQGLHTLYGWYVKKSSDAGASWQAECPTPLASFTPRCLKSATERQRKSLFTKMQLHERITRNLALTVTGIWLAVTASLANAQTWETILTLPAASNTCGRAILLPPFANEWSPPKIFVGLTRGETGDIRNPNVLILDQSTGNFEFKNDFLDTFSVGGLGFDAASGSVYAMSGSGNAGWEVRRSVDQGVSWSLVDTVTNATGRGFASDDQGNIFASGGGWIVRKSADHGLSWATVDSLTNASVARMHFVPGAKGGLFAVGYRVSGSGFNTTYAWLIRRSRDAGATWATVHTYAGSGNVGAEAITSDLQGRIYVAGWGLPEVVLSSSDGGDTWQTIHTNPRGTEVRAMAADSTGNLYLVGDLFGWFMLRMDSNGVWQDIEQPFGAGDGSQPTLSSAFDVAVDRAGNVYVTGGTRVWPAPALDTLVVQRRLSDTPVLRTAVSGQNLVLSWPASYQGFMLQSATTPANGGDWQDSNLTPTVSGDQNVVNVSTTNATGFFRLRN